MKSIANLAYRDVKYNNIILSSDGKWFLLPDFGISLIIPYEKK